MKLLCDWSEGGIFCDSIDNRNFEYLFLFWFRWFNIERIEKIFFKQLMGFLCLEGGIDNELFQYMLDNLEKVFFFFDGLDEFKYYENFWEEEQV